VAKCNQAIHWPLGPLTHHCPYPNPTLTLTVRRALPNLITAPNLT